jgi:UV DNA damage endonuclease
MSHIKLGYACINQTLRKDNVFTSRTMTHKTLLSLSAEDAIKLLKKTSLKNLDDLLTILQWNVKHNITLFRISSEIFPHITDLEIIEKLKEKTNHPEIVDGYFSGKFKFAQKLLEKIGKYINENHLRVSFHTTHYFHLASKNKEVVKKAVLEMYIYYRTFHLMKINTQHCVILHMDGRTQKNKKEVLERWEKHYLKLPQELQKMIILENDEFAFSVLDILPICEKYHLPFCLDLFHHQVYSKLNRQIELTPELLKRVIKTWKETGLSPKFHLSEQKKGAKSGAHADYVKKIPDILLNLKMPIAVMIEAKQKELALLKLKKN